MIRAMFFVVLSLAWMAPAVAQVSSAAPPAAGNLLPPGQEADRARRLDELFGRLRDAQNERLARALEREIGVVLNRSGSDTADVLYARAMQALERQDPDLSLSLLDAVVDLYPEFTEALNKRAGLHATRREFGRAMADLEIVLRREPRHFGAIVALGQLLQAMDLPAQALAAYRRAVEVNPHIERVPDIIRRLEPRVDGLRI